MLSNYVKYLQGVFKNIMKLPVEEQNKILKVNPHTEKFMKDDSYSSSEEPYTEATPRGWNIVCKAMTEK